MDVGGKVAYRRADSLIKGAPESEMAAETHARSTNPAGTGLQRQQVGDAQSSIFVVCRHELRDFPLVALVCPRDITEYRGQLGNWNVAGTQYYPRGSGPVNSW